MKTNEIQSRYPSEITKNSKNSKKSEGFGWISKFMIALSFLALFAIYCQITFPENLKSYVPQKFDSHPVRDLSSDVIPLDKNAYTHFNDPLISLCEDVEIGRNNIAYCVNERSQIVAIDPENNTTKKLGQAQKGISYGARLSKDEKSLYFVNSELGLCQFEFQSKEVRSLVSQFQGKFMSALNSIEVNPNNPNILYITQSNPNIPMHLHTIDILLNNPFGRVYEFNKETNQITLLADGLYFANGVVHQMYKGQEIILVAESNRFRLIRVYLNGEKRGQKEVAVDKLDIYLDNMKVNEKGEIWVAGPSLRDDLSYFADHNPWIRGIISRLPPSLFPYLVNASLFGGIKITFANNNQQYTSSYYLWNSLPNFTFATTLIQKDNKLFISSLVSKGILVFNNQDSIKKDHVNQKLSEPVEENL